MTERRPKEQTKTFTFAQKETRTMQMKESPIISQRPAPSIDRTGVPYMRSAKMMAEMEENINGVNRHKTAVFFA